MSEKIEEMHRIEKIIFFLNQHKILKISAKTYENNGVEVIVHDTLSLNEKHVEDKLGHKNLLAATKKYIQFIKSIDMN